MTFSRLCLLFSLLFVWGCEKPPEEEPALRLSRSSFKALEGWAQDDLRAFAPAFSKSCHRILKRPSDRPLGALPAAGTYGDWQPICRDFVSLDHGDQSVLRQFFEDNFIPYNVRAGDEPKGLFTGYYEASLRGSLMKYGPYKYPLHARPDDLIMVQLGDFRDDLKGRRIAGRVKGGRLHPYEDREKIVSGQWPHNDKVLVWVDDPVDAFFVQIQGSGLVELDNGQLLRIGYAGQNGHPYYAIGRELIARGEIAKEDMSMQAIRGWLGENQTQADEVMNTNRSYVFFRKLDGDGPLGGEGVALTAGRSLAIDRTKISYGVPLWVNLNPPKDGEAPLQQLMVAQDTGGAIRGAVRGDVFWGHGSRAEELAGHMASDGYYWVLLPKTISLSEGL